MHGEGDLLRIGPAARGGVPGGTLTGTAFAKTGFDGAALGKGKTACAVAEPAELLAGAGGR